MTPVKKYRIYRVISIASGKIFSYSRISYPNGTNPYINRDELQLQQITGDLSHVRSTFVYNALILAKKKGKSEPNISELLECSVDYEACKGPRRKLSLKPHLNKVSRFLARYSDDPEECYPNRFLDES